MALVLELAHDLEQVVLGVVDEHEPARADARDLAAQLAADRAAGAGHEHDLVGEVGADALELHPHRLAAEHVLDLQLAQLAHDLTPPPCAVLQQLEDGRERADRDPARAAGGDDAAAQRAGRGRDRDDHLVGLDRVEHAREVVVGGRAEHLEVVLVLHAALARVVVDEADGAQAEVGVAHELAHDEAAAVAAADDQHVARALLRCARPRRRGPRRRGARGSARRRSGRASAAPTSRRRRSACRPRAATPLCVSLSAPGAAKAIPPTTRIAETTTARSERLVVALADVGPQALVEPERGEDGDAERDDPQDRLVAQQVVAAGDAVVEAQLEREHVREGDEPTVHEQLHEGVAVNRERPGAVPPAHCGDSTGAALQSFAAVFDANASGVVARARSQAPAVSWPPRVGEPLAAGCGGGRRARQAGPLLTGDGITTTGGPKAYLFKQLLGHHGRGDRSPRRGDRTRAC